MSRTVAAIVLIMTRWHEDDLAGRLLAEADPKRGLDCGYDCGNTQRLNDINDSRRRDFPPSAAAAAAGAPIGDHPYRSKNAIAISEMGPATNNLPPTRGSEEVGDGTMSEVRGNLALVGHMHRCVPRARELPRVEAVRPPLPAPVTKKAVTKIPVTENRVTKNPRGRPRKEHPLTGA